MIQGFSIVICTFNPKKIIFHRLLNAIKRLNKPANIDIECIIVDNNSKPKLCDDPMVRQMLVSNADFKYCIEPVQGLTTSRIRGVAETKYDWLIFFDDDNEPDEDYLLHLESAIKEYPNVKCWGPSKIKVEFLEHTLDSWFLKTKHLFQERNWNNTQFASSNIWQDFYPYGTGLAVHRGVLMEYINRVNCGRYTLSDRKYDKLTSGGDLQIVLTAASLGYSVGTYKGLKINHIIDSRKSRLKYIERQVFGASSSYIIAHKQVNPNLFPDIDLVSDYDIVRMLIRVILGLLLKLKIKDLRIRIAQIMGDINARYILFPERTKPIFLRLYEKLLNA